MADITNQQLLDKLEALSRVMATKQDLKAALEAYPTKDDLDQRLKSFATKDDLKNFPTKDDLDQRLKSFATKADLKDFATKDDLKNFPTKDDLVQMKDEITSSANQMFNKLVTHIDDVEISLTDKIELTESRLPIRLEDSKADSIKRYDRLKIQRSSSL